MRLLQKTVSVIIVGALLGSFSESLALTNKGAIIASVDTLNTSIVTSITLKEKTLSDRANELGNRYDSVIQSFWFQSDEIEALTSIKKLWVPSFRQDIARAFFELKQDMLQDIKATQTALTGLRDEIALGYTDLSIAQKQAYDGKISDLQSRYMSFLSGSTVSTEDFVNTFSGRILSDTELVKRMMNENGKYIFFIRDIRAGYGQIDEKKTDFFKKKGVFEKEVLPKVQNGFLVFGENKKILTDAIRKDLTNGLEKAMVHDRIKKQETQLRTYIENIMSKWNEHLGKNFWQDSELLSATKDMENVDALEKTLHDSVYDPIGNIRSLDMSGSTLILWNIIKVNSNIANINTLLGLLIATYSTGNTLSSLNDKLLESYKTELVSYRADFTKLLEEKLQTALLEEKNHLQTLTLIDQEERILKQNLETVTSAEFTEQLVKNFDKKVTELAKTDGEKDTLKKSQMLGYRYMRIIVQKKIDDENLIPYYGKRISLDTAVNNLFISLEKKIGKEALLLKLSTVSKKIDSLLLGAKLSAKNRYSLLVVQSNILKYLEDATK